MNRFDRIGITLPIVFATSNERNRVMAKGNNSQKNDKKNKKPKKDVKQKEIKPLERKQPSAG